MLSSQNFSLINVANVESGLLRDNLVRDPHCLDRFRDLSNGIPILIPADPEVFLFRKADVFTLKQETILETVYGHQDRDYVGFCHAFKSFDFLSEFKVRDEWKSVIENVTMQNEETLAHVFALRADGLTIGAFQTRNIPHFGHEKIISRMLDHCDHLVINPVLGPKKKGDPTVECLQDIFSNFYNNKFNGRVSFKPLIANMFYAGPREAVHHARLRKSLGFDLFSVGRDHAGASNAYRPDAAINVIKALKRSLGIDVMCHSGAVFCNPCNSVVLSDECAHPISAKRDISGTEFRECLSTRSLFKFADPCLQKYLFTRKARIFEDD